MIQLLDMIHRIRHTSLREWQVLLLLLSSHIFIGYIWGPLKLEGSRETWFQSQTQSLLHNSQVILGQIPCPELRRDLFSYTPSYSSLLCIQRNSGELRKSFLHPTPQNGWTRTEKITECDENMFCMRPSTIPRTAWPPYGHCWKWHQALSLE